MPKPIAASNEAGAPRSDEVEVTPEMVAAGTAVLYRMDTHIADEEFWSEKVYRAMSAFVH
jgi:hypothetical protein